MTKKNKKKATWADWARAIIYSSLYIAFLYWVDAWWGLIVLPFIFDAYITRFIPWTWWKDAENPVVRFRKRIFLPELCDSLQFIGEEPAGG